MQVLRVELIRHRLFDLLLFLNALFELPLQHTLNGDSLDFLANPCFFQEAIESRTAVVRSFRFFLTFVEVRFDAYPWCLFPLRVGSHNGVPQDRR